MSIFKDRVVLLIGGRRLITEAMVRHFLEQGVEQVRAYSGDEEGLTALRDGLRAADAVAAARVKYYVGDVNDPAYLAEAMEGVDYVVYETWTLNLETCEADPADACMALLNPVNVVMDAAIQQKVQKLVVIGQNYAEPPYDTRSLIAVLLEKVVIGQGKRRAKDDASSISFVRSTGEDIFEDVNAAFTQVLGAKTYQSI